MNNEFLKPEDYEEPRCVLCMGTDNVKPIDARRFIEKLDEYQSRNDHQGAERHLKYWLSEARFGNDLRGEFTVYNEMMGFYRKRGDRAAAYEAIENTLRLMKELKMAEEISAGTAFVNIATVYKTFGESEKAMPYFEKAKVIYEKHLGDGDGRLGGFYNNMALALTDLKEYDGALSYYEKAISVMEKVENGELETAISYLNMANAREAQMGIEAAEPYITEYAERAQKLLDTPTLPKNGYYAFVCEKCAPTFLYYGYFAYGNELNERAKSIYERD